MSESLHSPRAGSVSRHHPHRRKLDVAESLIHRLLDAAVASADAADGTAGGGAGGAHSRRPLQPRLPLQVTAHYLRHVADWLVSLLLAKPAKQPPPAAAEPPPGGAARAPPHARGEPRTWALLGYTLEAAGPLLHGAASTAPPSLCSAAAAAITAAAAAPPPAGVRGCEAADSAGSGGGALLARALLRALHVLGARCALSYQPTLEQQGALTLAALQVGWRVTPHHLAHAPPPSLPAPTAAAAWPRHLARQA